MTIMLLITDYKLAKKQHLIITFAVHVMLQRVVLVVHRVPAAPCVHQLAALPAITTSPLPHLALVSRRRYDQSTTDNLT